MDRKKNKLSRVDRYEKQRKNTKTITVLTSIAGVLVIALIGIFLFGGESDNMAKKQETTTAQETSKSSSELEKTETEESPESEKIETLPQIKEEPDEPQIQELEKPDDPNVEKAYTADWDPVGTSQQGPHTVVIDKKTEEWTEILKAVRLATGLEESNMVEWWITRNGDQQVLATVSDNAETEIYRVYLQWETDQGYRPDKVEVLKENDQKYRYQ